MKGGARLRGFGQWPFFVLLSASCLGDDGLVPERLRLTGTCAAGETEIALAQDQQELFLTPARPTRLPLRGTLSSGGRFRDGNFTLAGGVCFDGPVPSTLCDESRAKFVACIAERLDWQLRLSCFDGDGAPVCEGRLDEL